jgi:hypothetical protein
MNHMATQSVPWERISCHARGRNVGATGDKSVPRHAVNVFVCVECVGQSDWAAGLGRQSSLETVGLHVLSQEGYVFTQSDFAFGSRIRTQKAFTVAPPKTVL